MLSTAKRLFLLICIFALTLFAASCFHDKVIQLTIAPNTDQNPSAININEASAAELEKLPGIGAEIAKRVVEHRERFGKFRRAEYLILVKGMSDKKFRELRNLIKAE